MKKTYSGKTKKPTIEKIVIDIVDHKGQRYDTVGDWFFTDDTLFVKTSRLGNDPDNEKALAVAVHEVVEVLLCRSRGITQKQVDRFDMAWEKSGSLEGLTEPGDDPSAPYHFEHGFATSVERLLIAAMGISWKEYEYSIIRRGIEE